MKLRNLLSGSGAETVYRADEKFDVVELERKEVSDPYFADPMYVFMDHEYNQFEVEKENMGDALNYLEDGLACELTFYDGKAISVELPTSVVREVTYTEPAVKGDTSGKVLKPAKLATGFLVQVPLFVNTGDRIEVDTRTGEYRRRVYQLNGPFTRPPTLAPSAITWRTNDLRVASRSSRGLPP